MLLKLNELIANILFSQPSEIDLFNPYSTVLPEFDRPNAPLVRQQNLKNYICDRESPPSVFLLAEAPGPWGCRYSGVPITSEEQLLDPDFPIRGQQSSAGPEPHREYSASIYWRTLKPYHERIFTWNSVPFHPHHPDNPHSIRTPRTSEIRRFQPLLNDMLDLLRPNLVLAVGRKAERSLADLGVDAVYVRHPSQGGATLFTEGVERELALLGEHP